MRHKWKHLPDEEWVKVVSRLYDIADISTDVDNHNGAHCECCGTYAIHYVRKYWDPLSVFDVDSKEMREIEKDCRMEMVVSVHDL
jgi:hypothetical protein